MSIEASSAVWLGWAAACAVDLLCLPHANTILRSNINTVTLLTLLKSPSVTTVSLRSSSAPRVSLSPPAQGSPTERTAELERGRLGVCRVFIFRRHRVPAPCGANQRAPKERPSSTWTRPRKSPCAHSARDGIRGQIPESAPWPELPTDGAVPAQTTQTALVATQAARQDARAAEREGAKAPV